MASSTREQFLEFQYYAEVANNLFTKNGLGMGSDVNAIFVDRCDGSAYQKLADNK